MKKQIFITNGTGGCGKDTFARIIGEVVPTMKISSIDVVKDIAEECGWDGGKTEKDRKFLSDFKMLLTAYNDLPFRMVAHAVDHFRNKDNRCEILLIDIREPEEIARAKEAFRAKTILIKNDRIPPITSNDGDANVFNYEYDYIIDNSGSLEDLAASVRTFVEEAVL